MKKSLHKIKLSLILSCLSLSMTAQFLTDERGLEEHMRYSRDKKFNTWSFSVGYGPLIMQNDLTSYAVFPDKNWNFGSMLMLAKQIHPAWAVDLQVLSGNFNSGNHLYYSEGNIIDYSANAATYINQWFAYPGPMRDRWNLYLKVGIGLTSYRTRMHFTENDKVVHYRNLAPENEAGGYIALGWDANDPYRKKARVNEFVIPLTLGLQYRINRSFDIGFETSMRWSLEDKLDDILLGADNDKYWYSNIHIAYKIGKKNKRHSRWTHRRYGFNVFEKPKKDPLTSEIALLEEQLRQLKERKIIKVDSVKILHHAKRIYRPNNMVSVYFDASESKPDDKDRIELATIGLYMHKNPGSTVGIYGYNDTKVKAEDNMAISKRRCEEVLSYFVDDLGFDVKRFAIYPKGENDLLSPKNSKSTNGINIINRRVDVVILKP